MELSEKYDLKRFEDREELKAEIDQRVADISDLEALVRWDVEEDASGESSSEEEDERPLIMQIEELSQKFEDKKLEPREAEVLSNKLAMLLLRGKDSLQGFEEEKFLWIKYKKGDAKEILDSTQTLVKILSFAVVSNSKAISFAFRYQQKLVEFSQYLLIMGCQSIAMNEAIVSNLNEALKNNTTINKKKLSQSTAKHLASIIQRLRDQQNIMQQQKHLADTQKELAVKQDQLEKRQGDCEGKQNDLESGQRSLAEKQESLVLKQSDLESQQRGILSEQKDIVEKQRMLLGSQQELRDLQKRYAKVLLVYGVVTAILLIGLIVSFVI